jgi:GTP-sensing pleiotropic transcriptional regulator CodY
MDTNTPTMPNADRDDESGQYTETYPPEDFITAIEAENGMAGTQDIADTVGCSYETAYKKLREMEDAGTIESKRVGNARLWLLPEDE